MAYGLVDKPCARRTRSEYSARAQHMVAGDSGFDTGGDLPLEEAVVARCHYTDNKRVAEIICGPYFLTSLDQA